MRVMFDDPALTLLYMQIALFIIGEAGMVCCQKNEISLLMSSAKDSVVEFRGKTTVSYPLGTK